VIREPGNPARTAKDAQMNETDVKIFYLKRKVIFPHSSITVVLKPSPLAKGIQAGELLIAYPVRTILDFILYRNRIATLAEVLTAEQRDDAVSLTLKGVSRVRLKKIISFRHARYGGIEYRKTAGLDELAEELRKKCQELIFLINVEESDTLINLMNFISNIDQLTDFISNYFIIDFRRRYRIYNELDTGRRIASILDTLYSLIEKITVRRGREAV
jgi:ATP-dependent Lon protease